jgi:hypothetical protein
MPSMKTKNYLLPNYGVFITVNKINSRVKYVRFTKKKLLTRKEKAMTKLDLLTKSEGYKSSDDLLRSFVNESIVPGICINPGCEYTSSTEPDSDRGYCEICDTNSVHSCLILVTKLDLLTKSEGYKSSDDLLRSFLNKSIVPGICINRGCEYTSSTEPDSDCGYCEICDTNSVHSCFILAGCI